METNCVKIREKNLKGMEDYENIQGCWWLLIHFIKCKTTIPIRELVVTNL